jgi:hypothetical protein
MKNFMRKASEDEALLAEVVSAAKISNVSLDENMLKIAKAMKITVME